jgi:crossover junction endodeoxyribonuclease RuvC
LKILGIDPGYATLGFGIIERKANKSEPLVYGAIKTDSDDDLLTRYMFLADELQEIIDEFDPDHAGVEKLYFNENVKTAINVAQARGVVLLVLKQNDLVVEEFTPIEIKKGVTGYGRAKKGQVQKMVKSLLGLKEIPKPDDAADALGAAICAGQTLGYEKKYAQK